MQRCGWFLGSFDGFNAGKKRLKALLLIAPICSLTQRPQLEKLFEYITKEPAEDAETKRKFKYVFVGHLVPNYLLYNIARASTFFSKENSFTVSRAGGIWLCQRCAEFCLSLSISCATDGFCGAFAWMGTFVSPFDPTLLPARLRPKRSDPVCLGA
jgi:hypothetical protein